MLLVGKMSRVEKTLRRCAPLFLALLLQGETSATFLGIHVNVSLASLLDLTCDGCCS